MIGILLVTHGRLAEELRAAALTIQPGLERIVAVALEWSETGEDASGKIRRGLELADEGEGAVILTDMFGGTPTNLTLPFLRKDRIEIVTGVNLPMLIKAASIKDGASLTEVARTLREHGRNAIWVASDLLSGAPDTPAAQPAAPAQPAPPGRKK